MLSAPSAEDALQRLTDLREPVDLMITDCVMPKIDGLELSRQLASRGARLPTLFVSGGMRPPFELPQDALFLPKPYDPERLLECVADLLERQSSSSLGV